MAIFKNFKQYDIKTSGNEELIALGVIFFVSDEGRDWYDSQKEYSKDLLKVGYDPKTKVIVTSSYDVSSINPNGLSVADVKSFPKRFNIDIPSGEFMFDEEKEIVITRVYSEEELKVSVEKQKSKLMAETMALIDPLKFAVDLDMATEEEKKKLEALKKYVVMLNRVPQQETYPSGVTWPELPTT